MEPIKMCISVVDQDRVTKDVYQCCCSTRSHKRCVSLLLINTEPIKCESVLLINKEPLKMCISVVDQHGTTKDVYQCC